MAQEKQLNTITEGKGAIPFSPKVNTSTVYDENGQPLNVVLRSVDGKFKECSHSIGEQREKTEGLQDTINEAALHNGEVQAAVLVNIASGTGLTAVNAQQAFAEIAKEIYPVQVAIASSNAGTYEIGDAQHSVTPHIVLSITRNGADVSSSAQTTSSQGEVQSDNKTITDSAISSGSKTYQIEVTQGGQTASAPNQTFSFMNYVYGFASDTKPASAAALITAITNAQGTSSARTLSTSKTKGSTSLAANKYYIFAVQGTDVNLVCRHAATDGVVSGCTTYKGSTKLSIPRINGTGSDDYCAIIVEKSTSAWNFKITNS